MDLKDNLSSAQSTVMKWTFLMFRGKLAEVRYRQETQKQNRRALNGLFAVISLGMLVLFSLVTRLEYLQVSVAALFVVLLPNRCVFLLMLYLDGVLLAVKLNVPSSYTFFELLALDLLSFLVSVLICKNFGRFIIGQALCSIIFKFYTGVALPNLIAVGLLYSVFFFMLEKGRRSLWISCYSYMKSNYFYFENLQSSKVGLILCGCDGEVLHFNDCSRTIISLLGGLPADHLFFSLVPAHDRNKFKKGFQRAIRGKIMRETLVFKANKDNQPAFYGFSVQAKLVLWNNRKAVSCCLIDISEMVTQGFFVSSLLKELDAPFKDLMRAFTKPRNQNDERSLLPSFSEAYSKVMCLSLLQANLLEDSWRASTEEFSIEQETRMVIDSVFERMLRSQLSVTLTTDLGVPGALIANRAVYCLMIYTLLTIGAKNAEARTNIALLLGISVQVMQAATDSSVQITVKIKFEWDADKATDLAELLIAQPGKTSRKNFAEIYALRMNYGVEIALFDDALATLRGEIKQCALDENNFSLSVTLPMQYTLDPFYSNSRAKSLFGIQDTPSTMKWKDRAPPKQLDRKMIFRKLAQAGIHRQASVSVGPTSDQGLDLEEGTDCLAPNEFTSDAKRVCYRFQGKSQRLGLLSQEPRQSVAYLRATLKAKIAAKNSQVFSRQNPYREDPDYSFTFVRPPVTLDPVGHSTPLLTLQGDKPTLLIAEDSRSILMQLEKLAKSAVDCYVDLADNGSNAVTLFEEYAAQGYKYFVIFMDAIMPELDGCQATARIRALEMVRGYPRTFICGISGDDGLRRQCLAADMDYFSK